MKSKYFLPVLAALMLTACHKDLDVIQTDQITASGMWKSEGDANSAMFGSHQLLRAAFSQGLVYWGEYRTGLWGPGNHKGLSQTPRDQVYQSSMPNTHDYADWENIYKVINNANLLLKYTPNISFANADKKKEVLANGYFVRAVCYYWIARIWGNAPLVLEAVESPSQELLPQRSSVTDILAQVEQDIDAALSNMPASVTAKKTASLASLNMLKADFSLWMYKVKNAGNTYLDKAETAVAAVLGNSALGLETNYASIFATASESGKEVIYSWNYAQDEYTGGYAADYQFNSATVTPAYHFNPVAVGGNQQWCFYTDDYVNVLTQNAADTRLATNYQVFFDNQMNQTFHWTNKYKGTWLNKTLILDADIILYRLADAYMFNAEIKYYRNDATGAVQEVNKLVKRAYGVDAYYSTSSTLPQAHDIIVKERMREFPAEGKLWWDFIRLGVAFDWNSFLAAKQNQQNILLWPISDNSINDNPNLGGQTPGWQ
ncbi:RagB/SusD family nutrient uptake outer membrane protein [Pseudobacter ginsenosidimutans]|uniref:SusD-like starch-binding protein associating with outer membrane n=1 Tax=Pseudobacter ginsenosidimutans TaxID=661488 RepID=A0A4Q7MCB8_9BACT|nr:RagB/SusD family nutrient uptake outer membrane protein [Pseudobacter ginsenosidimutans]QEC42563.1 RagB/SusD family nutrient uptake outer membrane protein [Pseudobacter ginsenosidimutans]RZS63949.1 SusD-like starch-binding protein associating with outer membrane [Pseudobacter ginsenosidimutans]